MLNIDDEIKIAVLNKDHIKAEVFRAIKNEILKFKTQKNAPEYTDIEEIKLLNKLAKSHEESIEAYKKANRDDLVSSEKAEVQIIYSLLPKPVDRETLEISLKVYIEKECGDNVLTKKDMGNAIKYLKANFPVNDGKEISNIVKSYLK